MRGLLKKLQCDNYLTLVAASSIIRPGVAKSGMMKEYINRFHNPQGFKYLHPVMEEQLKETFGVMVYQEDVIKICHHFAGLDLADADILRRAMAGRFRSKKEFERIRERFFSNCRERGIPDERLPPKSGVRWHPLPGMPFPRPIRHRMPWKATRAFT